MFCGQCGIANSDSAQYCSRCGNLLTPRPAGSTAPEIQNPAAGGSAAIPATDAPKSGKAIASLVCGIFTFVLPASIAAIILGHLSLSDIRKSAGRLGGRGIAVAGLVLGYAGIVLVPFILIIAAIAIPNLLRAKIAANEASAIGSLRTIDVAAVQYASSYENGFPSNFEAFGYGEGLAGNCDHAGLLDGRLATGQKNGYIFTYTPAFPEGQSGPIVSPKATAKGCKSGGASRYSVTGDPIQRGSTGQRSFYTDQTGVIRYSDNGEPATKDSPPLE
jgi:type IV pilus assembly protein PilA